MKKLILTFLFAILLVSTISAEFGIDNPNLPKITSSREAELISINNGTLNVNNSNYLQGYTWETNPYASDWNNSLWNASETKIYPKNIDSVIGIGTINPNGMLHVFSDLIALGGLVANFESDGQESAIVSIDADNTKDPILTFDEATAPKWAIGLDGSSDFFLMRSGASITGAFTDFFQMALSPTGALWLNNSINTTEIKLRDNRICNSTNCFTLQELNSTSSKNPFDQDLNTTASPSFLTVTATRDPITSPYYISTSATTGSVPYVTIGGVYNQDNANFFFDNNAKLLKIGGLSASQAVMTDANKYLVSADYLDQAVKTTSTPTFNGLNLTGQISHTSNLAIAPAGYTHIVSSGGQPLYVQTLINARGGIGNDEGNLVLNDNAEVTGDLAIAVTSGEKKLLYMGAYYANNDGHPNKIALYGDIYGFGVSAGSLDYISNGGHNFYTSTTHLMKIGSDGRVGIGTASPAQKLNVIGDANITGNLFVQGNINVSGCINYNGGTLGTCI